MRGTLRLFVIGGLLVALGLAIFITPFASSSPDGLERVATDKDFLKSAEDHAFSDSPVADYSVKGIENDKLSTSLAGLIGVLITFGVGVLAFAAVRVFRRHGAGNGDRRR
jgi:hypothetical protein